MSISFLTLATEAWNIYNNGLWTNATLVNVYRYYTAHYYLGANNFGYHNFGNFANF